MKYISLFFVALLSAPAYAVPVQNQDYPWLAEMKAMPGLIRLEELFVPPEGFKRIDAKKRSMTHWLRGLPTRSDRYKVHAYDGRPLERPAVALVAMDVGKRDLQQCADSAIRLHAEYRWHLKKGSKSAYHFTSGDRVTFRDWKKGERLKIRGSKVKRLAGKGRSGNHKSYRKWLDQVFMYAGTRSLRLDSTPVPIGQVRPGDFYVEPGGPGHAVVILDVAEAADGRRVALIGQGFMPAEDFHVVKASNALNTVWFPLPRTKSERLDTPSWRPFKTSHARRFKP